MARETPSGHNRRYYRDEEYLLVWLMNFNLSWNRIEQIYNQNVPRDRQRTARALENKYRQLLRNFGRTQVRRYPGI